MSWTQLDQKYKQRRANIQKLMKIVPEGESMISMK